MPILSLVVPAAVICMLLLARGGSRMEAHHAILMLVACVLTTGLVTNVVKVQASQGEGLGAPSRLLHAAMPNCAAALAAATPLPLLSRSRQVGRPRPDFVYHCWPRTLKPVFNAKARGGAPKARAAGRPGHQGRRLCCLMRWSQLASPTCHNCCATSAPSQLQQGLPLCEKGVDAAELAKARRSFPSGV